MRAALLALLAAALLVGASCSDDDSPPAASASAGANASAAATASPTPECASPPPVSPRGDTIFDTLAKGASTLGDFHPSFDVKVGDVSGGANPDLTYEVGLPE